MQRGRRDVQDTVVAVGRGATSVFRHKSQRRGFAQVPQLSTALSLAAVRRIHVHAAVQERTMEVATSEPTYRAEQGVAFGSSGCLK